MSEYLISEVFVVQKKRTVSIKSTKDWLSNGKDQSRTHFMNFIKSVQYSLSCIFAKKHRNNSESLSEMCLDWLWGKLEGDWKFVGEFWSLFVYELSFFLLGVRTFEGVHWCLFVFIYSCFERYALWFIKPESSLFLRHLYTRFLKHKY